MAFPLLHADLLNLGQQFSTLSVNYCNALEKTDIECSGLVAGPRLQKLAASIRRDMGEIKKLMTSYEEQLLTIQTSSLIFEDNNLVNFITMQQISDLIESVNHSSVFTGEILYMSILFTPSPYIYLY